MLFLFVGIVGFMGLKKVVLLFRVLYFYFEFELCVFLFLFARG